MGVMDKVKLASPAARPLEGIDVVDPPGSRAVAEQALACSRQSVGHADTRVAVENEDIVLPSPYLKWPVSEALQSPRRALRQALHSRAQASAQAAYPG